MLGQSLSVSTLMLMKAQYLHVTQYAIASKPLANKRSMDLCPMLVELFVGDVRVAPEVDREADELLRCHDRISNSLSFRSKLFVGSVVAIHRRTEEKLTLPTKYVVQCTCTCPRDHGSLRKPQGKREGA